MVLVGADTLPAGCYGGRQAQACRRAGPEDNLARRWIRSPLFSPPYKSAHIQTAQLDNTDTL